MLWQMVIWTSWRTAVVSRNIACVLDSQRCLVDVAEIERTLWALLCFVLHMVYVICLSHVRLLPMQYHITRSVFGIVDVLLLRWIDAASWGTLFLWCLAVCTASGIVVFFVSSDVMASVSGQSFPWQRQLPLRADARKWRSNYTSNKGIVLL